MNAQTITRAQVRERAKDDRDLEWLRLRRAGFTAEEIGKRFGVAKETVKVRTLEIRNADSSYHDPKLTPAQIRAGYWSSAKMCSAGRKGAMHGIRKDGLRGRAGGAR